MTGGGEVYSEAAYDLAFARTRDLLAELKEVDDSLAYLNNPYVIDPPTIGERAGTGLTAVHAQLGRTHPFQAFGAVQPLYMQRQVPLALPPIAQQAQAWATGIRDQVAAPLTDLKNSEAPGLADLAWEITHQLVTPLEEIEEADIGHLGETLGHWRGEAAGAFSRNFYSPFAEVNEQQRLHTARLAAAVGMQKAILQVAQQGMMNTVTTLNRVLDDQLAQRAAAEAAETREQIETATAALSIAGSVVGLIPGAATAGAVTGLISQLISFGANGLLPSADAWALAVRAASAPDVAASWLQATHRIVSANRAQQDAFETRDGAALIEGVDAALDRNRLFAPAPELDSVTPETWHHDSA